ncbi:uncharacterized protein G2W53_041135 [Senna tora]|uniref:Uncharacterized protein n=1 Tax=Senna tora TaxID=362788 RepID=A0A834W2M3_9FABA|nr:uncharacterized protein G2W53_041135 [Senna tora]
MASTYGRGDDAGRQLKWNLNSKLE